MKLGVMMQPGVTMQLSVISIEGDAGIVVDGIREVIDKYHKEEWADKTTLGYTRSDR